MDSLVQALGIYAATLVVGVLSGLIPLVNGELFLVGVVIATDDVPIAIVLGVLMAIGQMAAKVALYHTACRATDASTGRFAERVERMRARAEKWRKKPLGVTFVSAVIGLPPYYVVTLAAGILRIPFVAFLWIGVVGRTIRFVGLALIVAYA